MTIVSYAATAVFWLAVSGLAVAQSGELTPAPAVAPSAEAPAPVPSPSIPAADEFAPAPIAPSPAAAVSSPVRPTTEWSSLYDAYGLRPGQIGFAAVLGFPILQVQAGIGIGRRADLYAGFNSMYGAFNQPTAGVRITARDGLDGTLGLAFRVGFAYTAFRVSAAADQNGIRWLTGERDLSAIVSVSASARSGRGVPFFIELGYSPNLDLDPQLVDCFPCGPKPTATFGGNIPFRMGVELPLSRYVNFAGIWGVDFHLRGEDSPAMPILLFGFTFATGEIV